MITLLICMFVAFAAGSILTILYITYRMMTSDGWDDSNITNALRLLSHVTLHPEDFGKMQYPGGKRPFWYVDKDELSEVVDSRPDGDNK